MLPRLSTPELSSSSDDGLDDSASTMQRPSAFAGPVNSMAATIPLPRKSVPAKSMMDTGATVPRPAAKRMSSAPPPVDPNPFAKFEDDHVDDDGALPTEALVRMDPKIAEGVVAGMSIEDLATPSGLKKPIVRRTPPPVVKAVEIPAPPPRRPSLPSAPPDSGHTRVAPVQAVPIQTPPPVQAAPAYVAAPNAAQGGSIRARDIPPLAAGPAQGPLKKLAQPSHKIALLAAGVLLAAAMTLVIVRRAPPAAPVTSAQSAFPAPPPIPVEVQATPQPTVIATASVAPQALPQQAVPNVKTRRHASRPIPVHREQ